MSSLSKSSDEQQATFDTFIERVNGVVTDVFGADGATVIIGAQWGDMGKSDQPICLISTNLPVCAVGAALNDMVDEAEMLHRASHGLPEVADAEEGVDLTERVALADAPEEVQAMARQLMEQFGVSEEQVIITNHVDTADLAALPEFEESEPGDPSTVEGTD